MAKIVMGTSKMKPAIQIEFMIRYSMLVCYIPIVTLTLPARCD